MAPIIEMNQKGLTKAFFKVQTGQWDVKLGLKKGLERSKSSSPLMRKELCFPPFELKLGFLDLGMEPPHFRIETLAAYSVSSIILILCLQSVFQGISIGVAATHARVWRALWNVTVHKVFAAIVMGLSFLRTVPEPPLLSRIAYAFSFAVSQLCPTPKAEHGGAHTPPVNQPPGMVGLSIGEKHFIQGGIAQDLRSDGRKRLTYRPISVETGNIPQANGSARVKMGATDVIASVKAELGKPSPFQPDKGKVSIYVDCSPTAAPMFEGRGGDELSAELSAALQRCLLGGKSGAGKAINKARIVTVTPFCHASTLGN
ncbi:hypothetical protein C3L33_10248, partial [Rhododendron williamsianum]